MGLILILLERHTLFSYNLNLWCYMIHILNSVFKVAFEPVTCNASYTIALEFS